ncbi:GGDEF domain-containing protein [Pelagibius sp. Alg239-R121]|uniref:GGDEF domain-containing protein n=1 Tax=Pelagibius sp. Alg239-R121 TaxID=2993448 RepID=UPI0024A61A3F|nr:GGDEF domain-containing protein [Pelagibius sp. Alg239-R121]
MSASHVLKSEVDPVEPNSINDICSVSERLQRLAEPRKWKVDPAAKQLLEELLALAAEAEQTVAEQRERIRYLESLSMTDELTGLLNRRGFDAVFSRALARADRSDENGLLILCDLDHFKAINDTYGHLAGDAVLRAIGEKLSGNTRQCDAVARIGGDEFAILLTQAEPDMAANLTAKLNRMLNTLVVTWNGHQIPVSASTGFDNYCSGKTADTVMFLADRALYARKGQIREMTVPPCKRSRRQSSEL